GPKMAVPGQRRAVKAPTRPARPPRPVAAPQKATAPAAAPPAPARVDDRVAFVGAGVVAAIAVVVYAVTVQPSGPPRDSGGLVSAASVLGVAHPPGYPLYMLIGHLVTLLPGGSPALRMNLLSGVFDAVAVGIVFMVVYRLVASSSTRSRDSA